MAECPLGRPVGEPPSILNCPDAILGCVCTHHMMRYAFGVPTDRTWPIVEFWQQHPNPPSGGYDGYSEEEDEEAL